MSLKKMVTLTESQLYNIIKETICQVLNEHHSGNHCVRFTAQNIDNPQELMAKYPSKLPNKYYHHSTNKFGRQPFDKREGEKLTLHIVGRLTNDRVDALVVDNPNSDNEIPHITLATANGVRPVQSNIELKQHWNEIQPLDDYVKTTFTNNM